MDVTQPATAFVKPSGIDGGGGVPPAGALRSALYECEVSHHRLKPKIHWFSHHIFMLALDLDEIDKVASRVWGLSHNRRNAYEFRDRDHLTLSGHESASVKENLLAWIAEQETGAVLDPAAVRVTLLTLPRVFGHIFNPVSFYFVHDRDTDTPLCAVVQVGNTFGEMKPYLLRAPEADGSFRRTTPKHFYVSPFSGLELSFAFNLKVPAAGLEIHIDDHDEGQPVLLSKLTGRRQELSTARLWGATLKCPLVTLKVITLIHWHAFLLWLKRLPWHAKAAQPALQRDIFNPHVSLSGKKP